MSEITIEQYFAAYPEHPEITDEIRSNAAALLFKVNAGIARAEADGVTFQTNPHTDSLHFGTLISGEGNGGWRPSDCPVGAAHSKHKRGQAVDLCDANGAAIDTWSDENKPLLETLGIGREDPSATPNWCHWQDGPSPAGHWTFIP